MAKPLGGRRNMETRELYFEALSSSPSKLLKVIVVV
jgi:hypothetical protein